MELSVQNLLLFAKAGNQEARKRLVALGSSVVPELVPFLEQEDLLPTVLSVAKEVDGGEALVDKLVEEEDIDTILGFGERAIPVLLDGFALYKPDDHHVNTYEQIYARIETLVRLGSSTVPTLVRYIDDPDTPELTHIAALVVIGILGTDASAAAPGLVELYKTALEQYRNIDERTWNKDEATSKRAKRACRLIAEASRMQPNPFGLRHSRATESLHLSNHRIESAYLGFLAWTLGQLGNNASDAIPSLETALKDAVVMHNVHAAAAIVKIAGVDNKAGGKALSFLQEQLRARDMPILKHERPPVSPLSSAVSGMGPFAVFLVKDILESDLPFYNVKYCALGILEELGNVGLPLLPQVLALHACGEIRTDDSFLQDVELSILADVKNRDSRFLEAATEAFSMIPEDKHQRLVDALGNADVLVRSTENLKTCGVFLKTSENPLIRAICLRVIAKVATGIGPSDVSRMGLTILSTTNAVISALSDNDARVRLVAAEALARLAPNQAKNAVSALAAALGSRFERPRICAFCSLGALRVRESLYSSYFTAQSYSKQQPRRRVGNVDHGVHCRSTGRHGWSRYKLLF